jgi:hypothetical protein
MNNLEDVLQLQKQWNSFLPDEGPMLRASALDSLSKCAEAIATLSENLRKTGYLWISVAKIPTDELEKNIQTIETVTGASIPMILIEFWRTIGDVSFIDLENYEHAGFWEENSIHPKNGFADGIYIDACNDAWTSSICDEARDWKSNIGSGVSDAFILSLSPDGYHKDNISGGSPYGVYLEPTWKPTWLNFEWSGEKKPVTALSNPPDFLSYLRTAILECAGFPGLLGSPDFEPIKQSLLRGVPLF